LHGIRKRLSGAKLARWVPALHNLDLNTEHTLLKHNMANSVVNEVPCGLARVDHEPVCELHRLGAGSAQFAGHNDLAALGAGLHDETQNTIARTANGETAEELVTKRFALRDGGETTVLNLLGVEFERVFGELETLVDERGELADAAALLAENLLSVGSTDDNLSASVSYANLTTRVTLLRKLAGEELVEFCAKDTIGNELSLLANLSGHFEVWLEWK